MNIAPSEEQFDLPNTATTTPNLRRPVPPTTSCTSDPPPAARAHHEDSTPFINQKQQRLFCASLSRWI
jgi:hypothetical protein